MVGSLEKGMEYRRRTDWQTFWDFETERLVRQWSSEKIEKAWDALIMDEKSGAVKDGDEWLLPKKAGILQDVVDRNMTGTQLARSSAVASQEEATELWKESDAAASSRMLEHIRVMNDEVGVARACSVVSA